MMLLHFTYRRLTKFTKVWFHIEDNSINTAFHGGPLYQKDS